MPKETVTRKYESTTDFQDGAWYNETTESSGWQNFYYSFLADGAMEGHYDQVNSGAFNNAENRLLGQIAQVTGKMMQ